MKAMILAAGKGTRVRPLTYVLPKPMIPILGKPVMAYLIEHLAKCGVREIMANTSYHHEKIENYFGDGRQFGVEIGYSFEGYVTDEGREVHCPLGSAGGIKKIQEFGGFFDQTTIVICGDAIIDLDIKSAVEQHRKQGAMATIITKEVPLEAVSSYGVVVTDDSGRIQSFQEKPSPEQAKSRMASTGIYIFEPEVIDLIPSGKAFDIGSDLFPLMVKKGLPLYAQRVDFNWIDIGNIHDFWLVQQNIMAGQGAPMEMPGKQIKDDVWVGVNTRIDWEGTTIEGPVYIGAGSHIEAGSHIVGPTWIGHGSHVSSGASVIKSVLFDYTRILPDAHIEETVVCKDHSVDRHGNMRHISEDANHKWNNARDRRQSRRGASHRSPAR